METVGDRIPGRVIPHSAGRALVVAWCRMLLAKVEGSVVATVNDAHVAGRKLLLVRPQFVKDGHRTRLRTGRDTDVAVDSVGAGVGEVVVICHET